MKVTKEFLKEKNACREGVKAFAEYFPDGFELSLWDLEKQIEVLKSPLRIYIGWAFEKGVIPLWAMNNANLYGANLDGAKYDKCTIFPEGIDPKTRGARLVE